jgi:hypothetical protein
MFMSNSAARATPFLDTTTVVPAAQWVEVPLAGGKFELKLWGKFPPRWLANLTSGLAAKGITIHKGYANKLSPTVWQGTFELSRLDAQQLPGQIDYVALAQQGEKSVAAAAIQLEHVAINSGEEALFVEIKGDDSVGFLMTLLKTFAFCSLYPAEVSIDTPHGRVHDSFWLKGLGGSAPSAALGEGLRLELNKLLR